MARAAVAARPRQAAQITAAATPTPGRPDSLVDVAVPARQRALVAERVALRPAKVLEPVPIVSAAPKAAAARQEARVQADRVEADVRLARAEVGAFRPGRPMPLIRPTGRLSPDDMAVQSVLAAPVGYVARPRAPLVLPEPIRSSVAVRPLGPEVGPVRLASPESLFQRTFEQRQALIKEMGGSKESEAAVARALAYLAREQVADGRWSRGDNTGKWQRGQHEAAVTGLASLCFLGADHAPGKPGPYRETIEKAMDYLLSVQKPNGDIRGGGDMYDQGIATLALAEAAIMSGREPYRLAAIQGSRFILAAQNRTTGGWRYQPGDPGDTSVLGWEVMALYSTAKLGFEFPAYAKKGAFRWLALVSPRGDPMLAGYQNPSPTPSMTAEAAFSRMLLGQRLTKQQIDRVGKYLLANPPGDADARKGRTGRTTYYYWYYASLALHHMQGEAWPKWNAMMRDLLIAQQVRGGRLDGTWPANSHYAQRGGRNYCTAMAALTLEVYYRYLPMLKIDVEPRK